MYEIERKFLVLAPLECIFECGSHMTVTEIKQTYLADSGDWTLRCREIINDGGTSYLFTMKKRQTDITCIELEEAVNKKFFDDIAAIGTPVLHKMRYDILCLNSRWHVDEFLNPEHDGLILAEIELTHEDEDFIKPTWLGEEVTHKKRYKNVKMAKRLKR